MRKVNWFRLLAYLTVIAGSVAAGYFITSLIF